MGSTLKEMNLLSFRSWFPVFQLRKEINKVVNCCPYKVPFNQDSACPVCEQEDLDLHVHTDMCQLCSHMLDGTTS